MKGMVLNLTQFALFVSTVIIIAQLRKIRSELDRDAFERKILLHKTESLLLSVKKSQRLFEKVETGRHINGYYQ